MEKLDLVFSALFKAVIEAQKLTNRQHVEQIKHYFRNKDRSPSTITIQLPETVAGEGPQTVELPELAISPPSSIKIKELTVDFNVNLGDLDWEEMDAHAHDRRFSDNEMPDPEIREIVPSLSAEVGRDDDDKTSAKITVVFDQAVTPEAMHRISDLLAKSLPWS